MQAHKYTVKLIYFFHCVEKHRLSTVSTGAAEQVSLYPGKYVLKDAKDSVSKISITTAHIHR